MIVLAGDMGAPAGDPWKKETPAMLGNSLLRCLDMLTLTRLTSNERAFLLIEAAAWGLSGPPEASKIWSENGSQIKVNLYM